MNKKIIIIILALLAALILLMFGYCMISNSKYAAVGSEFNPVYPKGMLAVGPLGAMFQGDVWVKMLGSGDGYNSYDVIFSKGARTHWHAHSELQLLYILSGEGWYQEEGKPAQFLQAGDAVEIPVNVKHWHGAAANSPFEHLGLTMNPQEEHTEKYEEVSDEEYDKLTVEERYRAQTDSVNLAGLTFDLSDNVAVEKVRYNNRYGIELVADLYYAKDMDKSLKHPAIVIGPPYGGVKEQGPGVYANELAQRGFVVLAFDPSYNGESGGSARDVSSPEIFVEDFSAGVDFLGTRDFVDREKIGAIGICGSGGFSLTAAQVDQRIKAVATASMYDISSMIRDGFAYTITPEQRSQSLVQLGEQRWADFENGSAAVPQGGWPLDGPAEVLPEGLPEIMSEFFEYYGMERGWHPNTMPNFTLTSAMAFTNFSLMDHLSDISPRPVLIIVGENAHSLYYSEEAYAEAQEPKELYIVPGARHIDLYDGGDNDYIPFDKLESFFKENLEV